MSKNCDRGGTQRRGIVDRLSRFFENLVLRHKVLRHDNALLIQRVRELEAKRAVSGAGTNGAAIDSGECLSADQRWIPAAYPFPQLDGLDAAALHVSIVDVGAEALDFEGDIYEPLIRAGSTAIIGFDPFVDPLVARPDGSVHNAACGPEAVSRRILPYFIGDGTRRVFHINKFTPTSSLFATNAAFAEEYLHLAEMCETVRTIEVETRRLDEIVEVKQCDFLKVDVQGGDYDVVAGATRLLRETLFVHIEAEFAPLYTSQPLFSDIDVFLRSQGFELIDLVKLGWNNYRAFPSTVMKSRLMWADCIYMKEADRIAAIDPALLMRTAYIAHVNYRKFDLAAALIERFDRNAGTRHLDTYVASVHRTFG